MDTNGVLEIPCLGQPFQLAMLYDCRRDCLIPDKTLLDSDILTNALVCRDLSESQYKVFKGESLDVKMEMAKAEGNFKISVLTGLANVPNYASFFENRLPKEQQGIARVTLRCEKISKVEELDIELLKSVPLKDSNEQKNATHFVWRLLYGSRNFFVFDREVKRCENYGYVIREMQEFIESLPSLDEIPEMDREEAEKLTCTMYGDTFIQESPVSLGEAFMHLKDLRKHYESVVPIEARLLPLSTVDIEAAAARYVTGTDSGILSQVQDILENFADIKGRVSGFTTSKAFSTFLSIQKKISKFQAMVSQYTNALKKDLSHLLLRVRRGDAEMKEILAILEKTVTTPFNGVCLSSWVDKTRRELNLLTMYLESFKDFQFAFEPDQLYSVITSLDHDKVVCFSFMIDDFQDEQLQEMATYLRTGKWNEKPPGQKGWFENKELLKELKTQAKTFSNLAKSSTSSTNFVVTNISSQGKGDKIAVLKMFQDGQEVKFKPENIPLQASTLGDRAHSSRPLITTSKQNSGSQFDNTKSIRCGSSHTETGGIPPTRQLNPSSSQMQQGGKDEMFLTPRCTVHAQANLQETDQGVFARPDSKSRNVITKLEQVPSGVHESIPLFANEAGSGNQVTSSHRLAVGYDSSAKGGFFNERNLSPIKDISPSNLSSNEIRSVEDQSEDQEELARLPALTLGQKMRHHSEKIAPQKEEYVPVYKLPMDETLRLDRKMIVRKCLKDHHDCERISTLKDRHEKVLLVIGATGAGKSTLINGMINFIMGVQWEDDFRFKLVTEEVSSQHDSVTTEITSYTIHPLEGSNIPYTFTIIDTPGFGDTRGLERDKSITNQIQEFFSLKPPNGIDHLDGIGFVTQASQARLTPTQRYIFDSILSIFGKDVQNSFFMMITFSDGKSPPVLDAIREAKVCYQDYFKFNNSALFAKNTNARKGNFDKSFWEMGCESFENFFEKFVTSESVSLQLTNEVLKEREHLEALIEGLNPKIKQGLGSIETMRQEKLFLQQHEAQIEQNKEFQFYVPVVKAEEIPLIGTGKHTTTCLNCNNTCHEDCKIAENEEKAKCVAMDEKGNCQVCSGKCPWKKHKNVPYLIKYTTVREKRTSHDLKEKYDTAVSGKSKVEGMLIQLERCLQELRITVLSDMYKVRMSLKRLDEIALKPNPLTEVQYIELLIKNERREARPGWKDRVKAFEDFKKRAQMFSKIKQETDIPKLLDEIIPLEEKKNESKALVKRNNLGCALM